MKASVRPKNSSKNATLQRRNRRSLLILFIVHIVVMIFAYFTSYMGSLSSSSIGKKSSSNASSRSRIQRLNSSISALPLVSYCTERLQGSSTAIWVGEIVSSYLTASYKEYEECTLILTTSTWDTRTSRRREGPESRQHT